MGRGSLVKDAGKLCHGLVRAPITLKGDQESVSRIQILSRELARPVYACLKARNSGDKSVTAAVALLQSLLSPVTITPDPSITPSTRILLLILLWGSLLPEEFPLGLLQEVLCQHVPESPWCDPTLSPLYWPLHLRLALVSRVADCLEVELYSNSGNADPVVTQESLDIIKRFVTEIMKLVYTSAVSDGGMESVSEDGLDYSGLPAPFLDISDSASTMGWSPTSRYHICRMGLETVLLCCTVQSDQEFLDSFVALEGVYRTLARTLFAAVNLEDGGDLETLRGKA